jgi:pyruvate carboxylase
MLLRGANAVGYTSYADKTVKEFCKEAVKEGIDIFRIFDSLNYIENLKFGIDAVKEAGGVVEATICYTGDVLEGGKYSLDYYLDLTKQLVDHGTDFLAIKDMAGLMRPEAATALVGAIRQEYPFLPIHVHTHDTAGTGAASMLAAVQAGADIVDGAVDCLSNSTS